ncbi:hypothetical protein N9L24_03495, partial [Candidatus Marinamargulisbacteria bacterium]|nr:hypothetical protein [Candidatus Marinamargulisbacteria bacterium]
PALCNTQRPQSSQSIEVEQTLTERMLKQELEDLIDQNSGGYSTLVPGSVIEKIMPKADKAVCLDMISQITVEKIIDEVCEDKIGRRRVGEKSYSEDFYTIHEAIKMRRG